MDKIAKINMKTNIKHIFLFLSLLIALTCFSTKTIAKQPDELFVTVLTKKPVLSTVKQIDDLIAYCKKNNINLIFMQAYRANLAWFKSSTADDSPYKKILKDEGVDTFQYLIDKAHENGIEVHAWLNLLSLSKNQNAKILKKYGRTILTHNKKLKVRIEDYKIDNQYFLEPSDPRVHQELIDIQSELIKNYPKLDGVQYDYIRYPDVNPDYGYAPANVKNFITSTGEKTVNKHNPKWLQWKRDQVTNLVIKLKDNAHSLKPTIRVSTTGCVYYARAYAEAFQEWPLWINNNIVEFVTMMNYPSDNNLYVRNIDGFKPHIKDFSKVHMTVGAYKFVKDTVKYAEQYRLCEESDAAACVIFHYDSLIEMDTHE